MWNITFAMKQKVNMVQFKSEVQIRYLIYLVETEGKPGAVEIQSSLIRYLKHIVETAQNTDVDVIFYSDNCGQ